MSNSNSDETVPEENTVDTDASNHVKKHEGNDSNNESADKTETNDKNESADKSETIVDAKHTVFEEGQKPTLPLAPGALPYFKISESIVFTILFFALNIGQLMFFISDGIWPKWWWLALEVVAWAGIFYWLVFGYPKLKFQRTRWRFDEQGLFIYQGIIFRKQYAVPRSRVQHIDVTQGPIQRNYAIAELVVHTAGTMNASVSLTGIAHDTAVDIRDKLLNQEQYDAV